MTQYDIASKVLMETCREDLIRYFLKMDVAESELIEELPQQTASLRSSDFPVMVTAGDGKKTLAVIEIQSQWNTNVPLRVLEYRTRYVLKYGVEAVSCVLLLKKAAAADVYEDREVRFQFHLVKMYELDARQVLDEGPLCLMPFVPLMKNGPELIFEADRMIYQGELTRAQKAEMLTSMAILSGLVSKTLPADLINKRRDIMMESAAYDIIREDVREEVIKDVEIGMLLRMIEAKFGVVSLYLKNLILSESSEKVYLFVQKFFDFKSIDDIEEWWKKQGDDDVQG